MVDSLDTSWLLAAVAALLLMAVAAAGGFWWSRRRRPLVITTYVPSASTPGEKVALDNWLPRIAEELGEVNFLPVEAVAGPGGDQFGKGLALMKDGKYPAAAKCFERALKLGLTGTYVCGALCFLGRIALERGDLQRSVELFLKCLAWPSLTAEAAFSAAGYLHRVYQCAGMTRDAEIARGIAARCSSDRVSLNLRVLADIESHVERARRGQRPSGARRGLRWLSGLNRARLTAALRPDR